MNLNCWTLQPFFPCLRLAAKDFRGNLLPIAASDEASVLVGIYVRPYPTASQPDKVQQVGSGKNFTGDCLVRGYVTVNIPAGMHPASRCMARFICGGHTIRLKPSGAFLAAADGTNTVQITNALLQWPRDTAATFELAFNIGKPQNANDHYREGDSRRHWCLSLSMSWSCLDQTLNLPLVNFTFGRAISSHCVKMCLC